MPEKTRGMITRGALPLDKTRMQSSADSSGTHQNREGRLGDDWIEIEFGVWARIGIFCSCSALLLRKINITSLTVIEIKT